MLKIKDDVDMKELEKFGFSDSSLFNNMILSKTIEYGGFDKNVKITLEISENREISIYMDIDFEEDDINWINELDLLYDLIQAGLVEKVEE